MKIYIDDHEDEPIDIIAWLDMDGDEEFIRLRNKEDGRRTTIEISSSGDTSIVLYKEDIHKLYRALNIAKKEGWW